MPYTYFKISIQILLVLEFVSQIYWNRVTLSIYYIIKKGNVEIMLKLVVVSLIRTINLFVFQRTYSPGKKNRA